MTLPVRLSAVLTRLVTCPSPFGNRHRVLMGYVCTTSSGPLREPPGSTVLPTYSSHPKFGREADKSPWGNPVLLLRSVPVLWTFPKVDFTIGEGMQGLILGSTLRSSMEAIKMQSLPPNCYWIKAASYHCWFWLDLVVSDTIINPLSSPHLLE